MAESKELQDLQNILDEPCDEGSCMATSYTGDWFAYLAKMKQNSPQTIALIMSTLDNFLEHAAEQHQNRWAWCETHFWPFLQLELSEDHQTILGATLPVLPDGSNQPVLPDGSNQPVLPAKSLQSIMPAKST